MSLGIDSFVDDSRDDELVQISRLANWVRDVPALKELQEFFVLVLLG